MSHKLTHNLLQTTLVFSLVLMPGCNFFGSKSEKGSSNAQASTQKGAILCTLDNKPVIYEEDFNKNLQQLIQQNPYLGAMAQNNKMRRQILDRLVDQELILAKAQKDGIKSSDEFKKAVAEMTEMIERSVIMELYQKQLFEKISVADSDVEQYFNENKARFVKLAGGVVLNAIKFEQEAAANKFLELAKDQPGKFESLAKADKAGKFKSFGRINQNGQDAEPIPAQLKSRALASSTTPSIDKVVVNPKEVWVFEATDKKDSVFFELDEIRPKIEMSLKQNKFMETIQTQLKALRSEMTVNVNEEFFADPKVEQEEQTEEASAAKPAGSSAA